MRPKTPLVAADAIVELGDRPGRPIVLVERRHEPLGWALPGGFVNVGETVEHAAIREVREETGLDVILGVLLGCYSGPDRDPRGHTVSLVFTAVARGEPVARDDARELGVFDPARTPPLAFDHQLIIADYIRWRERQ
jgi:8-oxo-dGTP diphosphatase